LIFYSRCSFSENLQRKKSLVFFYFLSKSKQFIIFRDKQIGQFHPTTFNFHPTRDKFTLYSAQKKIDIFAGVSNFTARKRIPARVQKLPAILSKKSFFCNFGKSLKIILNDEQSKMSNQSMSRQAHIYSL